MYPFRDLLVSFTLCVTSTFGFRDDDKDGENYEQIQSRTSNNINESMNVPILPQGEEYRDNPIEVGKVLKFDIVEDNSSVDNDDNKKRRKSGKKKEMPASSDIKNRESSEQTVN